MFLKKLSIASLLVATLYQSLVMANCSLEVYQPHYDKMFHNKIDSENLQANVMSSLPPFGFTLAYTTDEALDTRPGFANARETLGTLNDAHKGGGGHFPYFYYKLTKYYINKGEFSKEEIMDAIVEADESGYLCPNQKPLDFYPPPPGRGDYPFVKRVADYLKENR